MVAVEICFHAERNRADLTDHQQRYQSIFAAKSVLDDQCPQDDDPRNRREEVEASRDRMTIEADQVEESRRDPSRHCGRLTEAGSNSCQRIER